MAVMRPFKALRPRPDLAQSVASAPYDVINTEEARALAEGNPNSFLRVIRSEIEFEPSADPHCDAIYERAAANLEALKARGVLEQDTEASLFAYRIQMGGHTQTGLFGCASLDEYEADLIKKHEKTRPDKEDDRTRHMLALGVQPGPVFLTFRAVPEIQRILEAATAAEPLYNVTTETGVRHTLWRLANAEAAEAALAAIPCMYVADGHHRIASAARARAALRAENPGHTGEEPYNFVLSAAFPHSELRILAYNRIIYSLPLAPEALLERLAERFTVREGGSPAPAQKGHFSLYLGGAWYELAPLPGDSLPTDPVEALDVSILQAKVLEPILGIADQRTDRNIDFVGGIRGTEALKRAVDSGQAACAFSMFPTSIEELLEVADNNQIMAPKSTWFEPKLRSGLLIHPLR